MSERPAYFDLQQRASHRWLLSALSVLIFPLHPLLAQEQVLPIPNIDQADWWGGDGISGDWLGLRPRLSSHGLEIFATYTVDVFGNLGAGPRYGAAYSGALLFGAELDLSQSLGWPGASLSTTWVWISGHQADEDPASNFLTISSIAGYSTLRALELWFEQNLLEDRLSFRVGQLAADSEFIISDYAALFINATFGWPAFIYTNLPEGGPAYPMGALGVRLAWNPAPWFTCMAGAFQGDVFEQSLNRYGFRYRLNAETGYTFLSETQIRWNSAAQAPGLPGQGKFGLWLQTGRAADPLAESTSSGNVGLYWILDQMLFREGSKTSTQTGSDADKNPPTALTTATANQGLGFFTRLAMAPPDRNVVNFYFDAGLNYRGLFPSRENDTLGIAFACAQVSNGAKAAKMAEGFTPAGSEMVLEATYQIQVNNWLNLQPDLQYILQPNATRNQGNVWVVGFRGSVTF